MKKVSDKRKVQLIEYKQLKEEWFEDEENNHCRICVELKKYHPEATPYSNIVVHHSHGKENELLNKVEWWIPLCYFHNNWIEWSAEGTKFAKENNLKFK